MIQTYRQNSCNIKLSSAVNIMRGLKKVSKITLSCQIKNENPDIIIKLVFLASLYTLVNCRG